MTMASASVRTRLVVMMTVTALFALVVAGGLVAVLEARRTGDALAQEMQALARLVGSRSSAALLFADNATARENLQALKGQQAVAQACLFDLNGAVVAWLPPGANCAPLAAVDQEFSFREGLDVRVQLPVRVQPDTAVIGAIALHAATAPSWARMRDQAASALLAAAGALMLAAMLAAGLQRLISQPLDRMRRVVSDIDDRRDLHLRVPDLGRNEFGRLATAFNGMLDTIERKSADLAAREAYSRTLFHDSAIAQLVFDDALVCVDCNAAALRLLGVDDRHAVVGQPVSAMQRLADDTELKAGLLLHQAREALARDGAHHFELRFRRPGREAWDAQVDVLMVQVDGRSYRHCTLQDLSEQRAAEAARDAQRSAEAANRAKSTFLSRMSHEMRTPLNAVLGFLQLLERDLPPDVDVTHRRHVAIARQAGWHLLKLIDDALDVVRIEAGRLEIRPTLLDSRRVLDAATSLCEAQAVAAGITLHAAYAQRELPPLRADDMRLQQVLLNLLSNAIKYNRPGGKVWIDAEVAAGTVQVSVTDNGLGIPESQREHLFMPFHRLGREQLAGIQGTGLGLSLSRELARMMGGDIAVHSTPAGGTRVVVTLPAAEAAETLQDAPSAAVPGPGAAAVPAATATGRVLYVEDNPVNLLLVQQCLLAAPGIQLLQAETGAQGLQLLADERPDLVLLDMSLPDMTGLQWLAQAAATEPRLPVMVIALSASAMPQEVSAARAAGVSDYWTKPIDLQRFLADLSHVLSRASSARALESRSAGA